MTAKVDDGNDERTTPCDRIEWGCQFARAWLNAASARLAPSELAVVVDYIRREVAKLRDERDEKTRRGK